MLVSGGSEPERTLSGNAWNVTNRTLTHRSLIQYHWGSRLLDSLIQVLTHSMVLVPGEKLANIPGMYNVVKKTPINPEVAI